MLDERRFQRGAGELVDPQRPQERVRPDAVELRAAAGDDARLRAAEELVAAERADRGAGRDALAHGRFFYAGRRVQTSAAEVLDHRQVEAPAQLGQLGQSRALGEPFDAEVRGVDAQEDRGAAADRGGVVGGPRPVGRAHLAQGGARLPEHVRHAEAAAYLDQLAARDEDLAARRQRRQRQQHRGGVVVDDHGGLGAGQAGEQPRRVRRPRTAPPGRQVVLQVRVAAGHRGHAGDGRRTERRAPQVGVHDDAAGVDDRLQRRRQGRFEPRFQARFDPFRGGVRVAHLGRRRREPLAERRRLGTDRLQGGVPAVPGREALRRRALPQLLDRRDEAGIRRHWQRAARGAARARMSGRAAQAAPARLRAPG